MISRLEGYFQGTQDTELFYQGWVSPDSTGTLVVTHGQGEYSEWYSRLAEYMTANGLDVYAWDLRGHGHSSGRRGHANQFSDYVEDLYKFLEVLKERHELLARPWFLVGHSMGGLITLKAAAGGLIDSPRAICLSSPLLGLALAVPYYKEVLVNVMNEYIPSLGLGNELRNSQLSRDPEILKAYEQDPFRHNRITPRVYLGFRQTIFEVFSKAAEVKLPLLMQLAGADQVVSTPESERFFDLVGSEKKHKIIYPGAHHEIFNDLDRQQVYNDMFTFIKEHK